MQLLDFGELLALHHLGVLKALREAPVVVEQRGVVLEHAAFYLEIIDAPGEGIGKGLENEQGKRLGVVVLTLDAIALALGFREADLRMLVGMGENVGDKREQTGGADIAQAGNHQDREN